MSHRQSKLYSELTLSIRNLGEDPPCVERYLLYYPEADEYPISAESKRYLKSVNEEAKAVCRTCPVIEKCLDYALSAREAEGVWGGTTQQERELLILAKKQTRLNGQ
jgi:hypothetical protein